MNWRDVAINSGKKFGLDYEIKEAYDSLIKEGVGPERAADLACYEWDIFLDEDEIKKKRNFDASVLPDDDIDAIVHSGDFSDENIERLADWTESIIEKTLEDIGKNRKNK